MVQGPAGLYHTPVILPKALKWLDTPSAFYDGPCEGIYLRIDEDTPNSAHFTGSSYLKHRGKLVRPDFLQQIEEQWTRQQFTKNIVTFS